MQVAFSASRSASRTSSLRTLLPPKLNPIVLLLLTQISGHPSCFDKLRSR